VRQLFGPIFGVLWGWANPIFEIHSEKDTQI